jgi:hypothetical protein
MEIHAELGSEGADGADFGDEDFVDIGMPLEEVAEAGLDRDTDLEVVTELFEERECGSSENAIA